MPVSDPNSYLPKEVAEKYEVVDWPGKHTMNFGRLGTVDLRALTVDGAENLVKRGFTKLRRREQNTTKPEKK